MHSNTALARGIERLVAATMMSLVAATPLLAGCAFCRTASSGDGTDRILCLARLEKDDEARSLYEAAGPGTRAAVKAAVDQALVGGDDRLWFAAKYLFESLDADTVQAVLARADSRVVEKCFTYYSRPKWSELSVAVSQAFERSDLTDAAKGRILAALAVEGDFSGVTVDQATALVFVVSHGVVCDSPRTQYWASQLGWKQLPVREVLKAKGFGDFETPRQMMETLTPLGFGSWLYIYLDDLVETRAER